VLKNKNIKRWFPKILSNSKVELRRTRHIIAVEKIEKQYLDNTSVVFGKEDFSGNRNDGFFTRIRKTDVHLHSPNLYGLGLGENPEFWGHYNMNLFDAAVDFELRVRGTGAVLDMLHKKIQEVKK